MHLKDFLEIMKKKLDKTTICEENKKKHLEKIAKEMGETDIFTPLEVTDNNIYEDAEPEMIFPFEMYQDSDLEERISKWQEYYKTQAPVFPLLEEETGINIRGRFGRTQLHEACISGDIGKIRTLLEEGADETVLDNNGYTPYLLALFEDNSEVIKVLEEFGIMK